MPVESMQSMADVLVKPAGEFVKETKKGDV